MANININLDFDKYVSHPQLVSDLSPIFKAVIGDLVYINILLEPKNKPLLSDLLILVANVVFHTRARGVTVNGNIRHNPNSDKSQYARRVDFFKIIDLNYKETFARQKSMGKFTEIIPYNSSNIKEVFDNFLKVILINTNVKIEVQQMLHYCMYEILDNVLNHSDYPNVGAGNGWCCAQYFPYRNTIRLMICDTGVGIHQSLTTHPKSKHKGITERQSLELCTTKGVTNSEGLGFGLFATSEFIKLNKGEMMVYSGNHYSYINGTEKDVFEGDSWNGTFVFMNINANVPVDYKEILPLNHSLPNDYQHFLSENFGVDIDLW